MQRDLDISDAEERVVMNITLYYKAILANGNSVYGTCNVPLDMSLLPLNYHHIKRMQDRYLDQLRERLRTQQVVSLTYDEYVEYTTKKRSQRERERTLNSYEM